MASKEHANSALGKQRQVRGTPFLASSQESVKPFVIQNSGCPLPSRGISWVGGSLMVVGIKKRPFTLTSFLIPKLLSSHAPEDVPLLTENPTAQAVEIPTTFCLEVAQKTGASHKLSLKLCHPLRFLKLTA